jgi:hypothetical protein
LKIFFKGLTKSLMQYLLQMNASLRLLPSFLSFVSNDSIAIDDGDFVTVSLFGDSFLVNNERISMADGERVGDLRVS